MGENFVGSPTQSHGFDCGLELCSLRTLEVPNEGNQIDPLS